MKITIIGAGIAGLTTAIALRKSGFETEVFEAAPKLEHVGSGLGLAANAFKALAVIGLADKIKSRGSKMYFFEIHNKKGKVLSSVSGSDFGENIAIHRADLHEALLEEIRGLIRILEHPDVLLDVIRTELRSIKEEYGDARRSEIRASEEDLDILDLIAPEDVVVTVSHAGYAKRQPATSYRAQKRGGKGRNAAATKDEDFIDQLWLVNTHDTLLTFTSAGRVFWLPVHQLPDAGPNARGRPIINWIPLTDGEKVQAVLPVREYEDGKYVFFATRDGTVKKTALTEFAYRLQRGKIAINLDEGDALVNAALTDGSRDIMLFASNGKAVRFDEGSVRGMGRTATGVRGMRLTKGETVRSLIVIDGEGDVLTASERGFGKRTGVAEFPKKGRGTQGVIALKTTDRNGQLVGAIQLSDHHDVLLISDGGTLVRTPASAIAQVGRNTQGVTLMRLAADETLQAIERLDASLDVEEDAGVAIAPLEQPQASDPT